MYFDWDRSDLTADARSVITQAANYAKSGSPTRILVVGHADTSGNAQYNIGLSNRRARTVADALVSQGVNGGVERSRKGPPGSARRAFSHPGSTGQVRRRRSARAWGARAQGSMK